MKTKSFFNSGFLVVVEVSVRDEDRGQEVPTVHGSYYTFVCGKRMV